MAGGCIDGFETRFSAAGQGVAVLTALAPFDDDLSMKAVQRANEGVTKRPKRDHSITGLGGSVCS